MSLNSLIREFIINCGKLISIFVNKEHILLCEISAVEGKCWRKHHPTCSFQRYQSHLGYLDCVGGKCPDSVLGQSSILSQSRIRQ